LTREAGHPEGFHAHVFEPAGMKTIGVPQTMSPADLVPMVHSSISYAFTIYNDDAIIYAASAQRERGRTPDAPVTVVEPVPVVVPEPPQIGVTPVSSDNGPFDPMHGYVYRRDPIPILDPRIANLVLPLPGGTMGLVGGLMRSLGRGSVVPLARGSLALKASLAAGFSELVDLFTPGIDLPSPSDIPGALATIPANVWNQITTIVDLPRDIFGQFFGFGGGDVIPEDTEGHGPIVKTWRAPEPDGVPFVLTQQGWIGARRLNGTWSWYKPKKPMVITPGIPLDARQARKLALIYKREKRKAAKVFGLVERKPKSSAKTGMRVVRTGHGDDVVVIND